MKIAKFQLLLALMLYPAIGHAQTSNFYVNSTTGDVGIGTSTPTEELETAGAGKFTASSHGFTVGTQGTLVDFDGTYHRVVGVNGSSGTSMPLTLGTGNNNRFLFILPAGTVGIGTGSPRGGSMLDVNGTVYVESFASASSTTVCQNGNILSTCSSARRYKENIEPSPFGLKEVLAMQPITFDFLNHEDNWEKHDFGFLAEDMERINPLFVTYNKNGEVEGVRYMQLTAVNAKAIQDMYDIILNQQAEIDELKQMMQQLKLEK